MIKLLTATIVPSSLHISRLLPQCYLRPAYIKHHSPHPHLRDGALWLALEATERAWVNAPAVCRVSGCEGGVNISSSRVAAQSEWSRQIFVAVNAIWLRPLEGSVAQLEC